MEYEQNSFNNYDFFKKENLDRLICNLHCNWKEFSWAEKDYGMMKQIFVWKICKVGHGANLAFEYIYPLKLIYAVMRSKLMK